MRLVTWNCCRGAYLKKASLYSPTGHIEFVPFPRWQGFQGTRFRLKQRD